MISLSHEELALIVGGDAAATRPEGTNSWGEKTDSSSTAMTEYAKCMLGVLAGGSSIFGMIYCKLATKD